MKAHLESLLRRQIRSTLLRSQRGQASLMVGIMMLTFLLLFCFVINIGMLVNAKINLQNAADMAAYAGAAVQARQLNQISFLNYEMRRQYKKFLFRYYVIGNMAQASAPRSAPGAGTTPRYWSPNGNARGQGMDYNVPIVCMIFKNNDNFCHLDNVPKIVSPPSGTNDQINNALIAQLKQFEQNRQNNCISIGVTNHMTLQLWLWNTDPTLQNLISASPQNSQTLQLIAGLAQGVGLVPKNILLRERINTLTKYLNQEAQGVRLSDVQNLEKTGDPSRYERTIQAFYSAIYTLGNHTFSDEDGIEMDEVLAPQLVALKDIKARFDAYAIQYTLTGGNNPINAKDCVPSVVPEQMKTPLVVGVAKDPKVLTFYAVRLHAKAKILFSPWGDIDLKAYSAAQPFGSRIGPPLDEPDWTRQGTPNISLATQGDLAVGSGYQPTGLIPNLPVRAQDSAGTGQGWDTNEVLGTFFGAAFPDTHADSISPQDLERAYQIAMIPNPWESGYYNIPNDLDQNFAPLFDAQKQASIWAPVVPPGSGSVDSEINSLLEDLITETNQQAIAFKQMIKDQVTNYIAQMKAGKGEDGEGFNVVRISDPFYTRPTSAASGAVQIGNLPEWLALNLSSPGKILTSWNHPNDATWRAKSPGDEKTRGRMGYSVKFVSFASLENRLPSNGTETSTNAINQDEEAQGDIPWLKH